MRYLNRLQVRYFGRWKLDRAELLYKNVAVSVGIVSLSLVLCWSFLNFKSIGEYINFDSNKNVQYFENSNDIWGNEPNRIEIPSLNVIGKVSYPNDIDTLNKNLDNAINHYPDTVLPGEDGNSVFTAHSSSIKAGYYSNIFATISKLNQGDLIYVYKDSVRLEYKVVKKQVIGSNQLDFINDNRDKPSLTLVTCWPLGTDLKRLIVEAIENK